MFLLIIDGKIEAEHEDFDVLVERADENMEGFVVAKEDWEVTN